MAFIALVEEAFDSDAVWSRDKVDSDTINSIRLVTLQSH